MGMTERLKAAWIIILAIALALPSLSIAAPHYGATFSYAASAHEPSDLHGYQLMLDYDPDRFKWRKFNIYFDGGFSHFWVNNTPYYTTVNIYSVAPVVRYTFKRRGPVLPYLELSIGLAYLNHTRIENRNLGIHFSFQDRMGIGALLGASEKLSVGIHAVHYSNAHLSSKNSGITVPLVLDVGYRFS